MRKKNTTKQMMKNYIMESLLVLMNTKEFSEISIKEITDKAGVNRSTYYRNFNSKEEIIKLYLKNIMNEYLNIFESTEEKTKEKYFFVLFNHFYNYKSELLKIYKNNLSYLLLDSLNDYFQKKINMENHFEVSYHIGGIYNFFLIWFSHNMSESPKELVKITLNVFPENVNPMFF